MFLFQNVTLLKIVAWCAVVLILMLLNEIARANKWISLLLFLVLPIALTLFVWPKTAGAGSSTGTWFHWVKVYSALAGCLGFMAIRFIPKLTSKKWLLFPPLILALNITEAVIRDFQVDHLHGLVDGVVMNGGVWNIMNGTAGILNILALSGWYGIRIGKSKHKDMLWPDQIWTWVIAYDIWNFAYVYNCVGDHAFYAGLALLIAPTLSSMLIKKGSWLQARAQTLAFWMMFTMSYPSFVSDSPVAVMSTHNSTALFIVSLISLLANIAVFGNAIYRIIKNKHNPLKDELYTDTNAYQAIIKSSEQA